MCKLATDTCDHGRKNYSDIPIHFESFDCPGMRSPPLACGSVNKRICGIKKSAYFYSFENFIDFGSYVFDIVFHSFCFSSLVNISEYGTHSVHVDAQQELSKNG
jgi:hypothetical protein